ncbi:hypothetical protein P4O66_019092 [Electrophorus voltai]|uniref:Uncharacterized protein n=1 Tax=Electrophorus voltai TaxID=2609070 RepID=A0AAD8YNE4_9TELE|nr:hypothetical protein P4O66_019092 [Electrophorus voltai]
MEQSVLTQKLVCCVDAVEVVNVVGVVIWLDAVLVSEVDAVEDDNDVGIGSVVDEIKLSEVGEYKVVICDVGDGTEVRYGTEVRVVAFVACVDVWLKWSEVLIDSHSWRCSCRSTLVFA